MKNSVKILATLMLSAFVFSAHAQQGAQTAPAAGTATTTDSKMATDGKMADGKMMGKKRHGKMHHGKMKQSGTKMKAKM